MWRKGEKRIFAHSFQPAASPTALKRISRTVRRCALHHPCDKSLTELAAMYNRASAVGSATTATSSRRSCVRPSRGSMPMSFDGPAASSSGCAIKPRAHGIGFAAFVGGANRHFFAHWFLCMATAEHREPCDSRGSCTVLGAPGGANPPGDSTFSVQVGQPGHARFLGLLLTSRHSVPAGSGEPGLPCMVD
jgi:hypothetical protein